MIVLRSDQAVGVLVDSSILIQWTCRVRFPGRLLGRKIDARSQVGRTPPSIWGYSVTVAHGTFNP